jgi:hypothetical protein
MRQDHAAAATNPAIQTEEDLRECPRFAAVVAMDRQLPFCRIE